MGLFFQFVYGLLFVCFVLIRCTDLNEKLLIYYIHSVFRHFLEIVGIENSYCSDAKLWGHLFFWVFVGFVFFGFFF